MDDSNPKSNRKNLRKGIFLLPNLFTTGALFAGFYAIIAAMKGHYDTAAMAIFVAMLLDGLDGRVARMTNTQSAFGAEYDSLSDMVSFGVAPALVMFVWSLSNLAYESMILGKLGWLAAFIYTTCTALRLARFNTQIGTGDKRYFQGLACPRRRRGCNECCLGLRKLWYFQSRCNLCSAYPDFIGWHADGFQISLL